MTWTVSTSIQAQNIVSQLSTLLQSGGWTLYDNVASAPVLSSTNSQGATQYIQITQVGSYTYIQLQAFVSWNSGTHAGTEGSSTSVSRIYIGASARGSTETVDIYSTVTTNRFWVGIVNPTTNYRNWAYFGGLDTGLAGTNDQNCVLLVSSYETSSSRITGQIKNWAGGSAGSHWNAVCWMWPFVTLATNDAAFTTNFTQVPSPYVGTDSTKVVPIPPLCMDIRNYNTAASGNPNSSTGIGPAGLRGYMDGVMLIALGSMVEQTSGASGGVLAHLDTIVIGSTTYLIFQPGGTPTTNVHPWTGSYSGGALVVAEV